MKIKELKISNILSFKHYDNIEKATKITFDKQLNILIGENGAGKSTALEVINFIFKRVLFMQVNVDYNSYLRKNTLEPRKLKTILTIVNNMGYSDFRLEPNWNTENQPQKIQIIIDLDKIDIANIKHLVNNAEKLNPLMSSYSSCNFELTEIDETSKTIIITIDNNKDDRTFKVLVAPDSSNPGYLYLINYNFYKELINLYNSENPQDQIDALYESFVLISGYRNYHSFSSSVSLQSSPAVQQIQQIQVQEYSRSTNTSEQSEPSIFNTVRLRVAKKHFELYGEQTNIEDCEKAANKEAFLLKINQKLKLINLKIKIQFTDKRRWMYSFKFFDIKRKKELTDINSLSAGQKAIIHLVFEAYGRDELKGGLVIIDEPELHLHYQFQNEYLKVIEDISKEQNCQYILVTHSESLINSHTIHNVKRFFLDSENHTGIKNPALTEEQKFLVKVLDNTRSTCAFFAKKVILVEGEIDRYFFKAMIKEYKPDSEQQLAVLDIGGKSNYTTWKEFFESFGLTVYFIGDLDNAFNFIYTEEIQYKLNEQGIIDGFKCTHPNLKTDIEQKYHDKIFILKNGDIENYLEIHPKGLPETINFCNDKLTSFLNNDTSDKSKELRFIFDKIVAE
ncbi:MAG: AAA family ATPase [Gammaproteobacteria bacterium]|nr:AAA family ATPase [Gammaproteobacteria bacterium]